jgi:iron complex outermembrane receptor protein
MSALVLQSPLPAFAQRPAPSRELLLFMEVPIVVSGTGREQPLARAPSAISVVSAEDIRHSGSTSLPDVLRFVPGLDFQRASASNVLIGARGLNAQALTRMQVLLDGQSVYEDVLGLVYWHQIPVPLAEIERIEVVKSPSSALYGDKAFGGLVNIVTRSPEALRGTFVSQTAGQAGTEITDIIHGGTAGPLGYKLSLGYDRTNQFPNPPVGRTDHQLGREDVRARGYLEGRVSDSAKVWVGGALDWFDRREFLPTIPQPPIAIAQVVVSGLFGYAQANFETENFKAKLSYSGSDVDIVSDSLSPSGNAVVNVVSARVRHSFSLGTSNVLTAGASYRFATMDSAALVAGTATQQVGTMFLQDEWRILDPLTLTTGVGVDVHSVAGVTASPRAALVYTPWPDHAFRVSFAQAYRNPSLLENFFDTRLTLVPVPFPDTLLGNTSLEPERVRSYEAGYHGRFFDRIKWSTDFFYAEYARLITAPFQQIAPGVFQQVSRNGEGATNVGMETALEIFVAPWLTAFGNYSFQYRTGNLQAMGGAPRNKGNAGVTLSAGNRFAATALAHISGPFDTPDSGVGSYATLDLKLGYRFRLLGADAELAAYAFNLLNDEHRESTGGDLIERRVSGTLRIRF